MITKEELREVEGSYFEVLQTSPILSWRSPKSKQGIPTTPNVPESLVFSGFPDILFIPFVSIKIQNFIRDIKNPYCFRCKNTVVKVSFCSDGGSFQELLQDYFSSLSRCE